MIRALTGIPLIIISHNAINLEKPPEQKDQIKADLTAANVKHDIARRAPSQVAESGQLKDMEVLNKLKKKLLKEDKNLASVFKRKKAKGPNPLSCKKKKNTTQPILNKKNK